MLAVCAPPLLTSDLMNTDSICKLSLLSIAFIFKPLLNNKICKFFDQFIAVLAKTSILNEFKSYYYAYIITPKHYGNAILMMPLFYLIHSTV